MAISSKPAPKATGASADAVFIKFYAPWCGHCKDLQPVWESLGDILSTESGIVIAKVDATQDKAAARRFGITGYPSLRLVKNGQVYEHVGSRQLPALESFVRTGYKSAPPTPLRPVQAGTAEAAVSAVVDLSGSSPAEFDRTVADASSGIWLEFYAPWCGHCKALAPEYETAAAELKDEGIVVAKVDATMNTEQTERFEVTGYPTLFWVFGGQLYKYNGPRKASALIEFAKGGFEGSVSTATQYSALPVLHDAGDLDHGTAGDAEVVSLTDATFEHLTQASTGATTGPWFVKFYAPWCGHCKKMAPQWQKLAGALKGRVNVAEVDCTQERATCQRFKVAGYPSLKYIDQGKVWSYTGGRSAMRMQTWAETGRLASSATPSEAVPPPPSAVDTLSTEAMRIAVDLQDMLSKHTVSSIILAAAAFVAGLFCMMVIVLMTETPRQSSSEAAAHAALEGDQGSGDDAAAKETKKDQ